MLLNLHIKTTYVYYYMDRIWFVPRVVFIYQFHCIIESGISTAPPLHFQSLPAYLYPLDLRPIAYVFL